MPDWPECKEPQLEYDWDEHDEKVFTPAFVFQGGISGDIMLPAIDCGDLQTVEVKADDRSITPVRQEQDPSRPTTSPPSGRLPNIRPQSRLRPRQPKTATLEPSSTVQQHNKPSSSSPSNSAPHPSIVTPEVNLYTDGDNTRSAKTPEPSRKRHCPCHLSARQREKMPAREQTPLSNSSIDAPSFTSTDARASPTRTTPRTDSPLVQNSSVASATRESSVALERPWKGRPNGLLPRRKRTPKKTAPVIDDEDYLN